MGGKSFEAVWQRLNSLYRSKNQTTRFGAWGLSALAVVGLAYLVFSLTYLGRVYPNVTIGTHSFAGLHASEVQAAVAKLVETASSTEVTLKNGENSQIIRPEEIEWQVDVDATTKLIVNFGRNEPSRWVQFYHQVRSIFAVTDLTPVATFDDAALRAKIGEFTDRVDQPAINASGEIVADELVLAHEKAGSRIDGGQAYARVLEAIGDFESQELNLQLMPESPKVVLEDEEEIKLQVEELSNFQLKLEWEDKTRQLTRKDIRQLIGFVAANSDDTETPQSLVARFTTDAIQNYLTTIASVTDSPAIEPQLVIQDGRLAISRASREGKVVDLPVSAAAVLSALNSTAPSAKLTLKAQTPVINESNLASLGIKERIGFGETNFVGSPSNRIHNINNGVSLMQSALIKPGEEFSTVKTLGAVDNTTGFLPELVIKDNRTTPEFGGGLCQVSTTLFRSVLNAGLKVTERQNHSYRVSYYEPPVGLDATIYLPRPDFKFFNDTPGHILIQGKVVGTKVIFELWGTSDGRTASVSDPVISNVIEPGEPIYAETDTLFVGETKQIEKPHAGATATAIYTVMRNGEVINKQTFKSVYKVWPARFLVGTKVPPPAE